MAPVLGYCRLASMRYLGLPLVVTALATAVPASGQQASPAAQPPSPPKAVPQAVIHEVKLSDVFVGYDAVQARPILHRISVAVMMPADRLPSLRPDVSRCLRESASIPSVAALRRSLSADSLVRNEAYDQATDDTGRQKAKAQANAAVDKLLETMLDEIERQAKGCGKLASTVELQVALVRRVCGPTGPRCSNQPSAQALGETAAAGWVLTKWLLSRTDKVPDAMRLNEYLVLATQEDRPDNAPGDTVQISRSTPKALDAVTWPAVVGASPQELYEEGVRYLRKAGGKYSPAAPVLMDMPIQIAAATIDVLEAPASAVDYLRSQVDASLKRVSDEVARTRIRECVQLRATKPSSAAVEACTGYKVGESDIEKCLLGGDCRAKLSEQAKLGVVELVKRYDLKELAQANLMPRLPLGQYGPMVDAYSACMQKAGASESECALSAGMSGSAKKAFDCVKKENGGKATLTVNAAVFDCAAGSALGANEKRLIECARENGAAMQSGKYQSAMDCALKGQVPDQAVKLAACYRDGKAGTAAADCALQAVGGRAASQAQCVSKAKNAREGLLCFGDKVPKEAMAALECGGSADASALALCVAGSGALRGDLGKLAKCAVQSQGSPMGTGVCMYADKLNVDQQILLQCAVSSGGEPTATSICALGQLGMKELKQCKGKKFGEGPCFGQGNEFQKLVKAITGDYIKPSSVVGQLLNAHLSVLKSTVGLAEAGVKAIGKLAENAAKELDKIRRKPVQAALDAPANVVREGGKAVKWVGDRLGVSKPLRRCCRIKL